MSGPCGWNKLPTDLYQITDATAFKNCMEYLFNSGNLYVIRCNALRRDIIWRD